MNLTLNQKIAFTVALCSFLAAGGSATDLITLFGSTMAKSIAAASSIIAGAGGIFLGFVTGQASLVKDVQAMPGVEKIIVNKEANATLATLAVSNDPANAKIEPTPQAATAVEATAKAAT